VDVAAGDTAETIAATVNGVTGTTGVTATAVTKAALTVTDAGTVTFTLAGTAAQAISATLVSASDLTALRDAVNESTGTTGVSAVGTGATLTLTQADGKDIKITGMANDGTANDASVGSIRALGADEVADAQQVAVALTETTASGGTTEDSATVAGSVTFSSDTAFSITSNETGANGTIMDQNVGGTATTSSATLLSSVNISTENGAQTAISTIDAAIQKVSTQRAELGALQARFDSIISNLTTGIENQSAAQSRIRDADFATETAALTRAQILQQAGTAVLAQANAAPQNVLALLQ
jgi:flagellin